MTVVLAIGAIAGAAEDLTQARVKEAMRKGVEFYRTQVGVKGLYLWQYSEDLSKREGEGKATPTQGWVQPPGTPTVGMAILQAWEATKDPYYLDAVRETAHALAWGQLKSGGWTYLIDFDPASSRPLAYHHLAEIPRRARNVSTLDDDTTQSALRFLVQADRALGYKDEKTAEAARYGLEKLMAAQRPGGGWPQGWDAPADAQKYHAKKAAYPQDWPRTYPGGAYWEHHTFNDNSLADAIRTLFDAWRIYREPAAEPQRNQLSEACRAAAIRAGEFVLSAQMPEPQPAWAQQYDAEMHPAWARKFEPPAISGGESHGAMKALLLVYRQTGDKRFLEPIPKAVAYLQKSRRPDGRLARFYELRTNRPLYFTKDYQLTYDDRDTPTHYAFVVADGTEAILREYDAVRKLTPEQLQAEPPRRRPSDAAVRAILGSQDPRGRWVEDGRLRYHGDADPTRRILRSATFAEQVTTLATWLSTSN